MHLADRDTNSSCYLLALANTIRDPCRSVRREQLLRVRKLCAIFRDKRSHPLAQERINIGYAGDNELNAAFFTFLMCHKTWLVVRLCR